MFAPQLQADQRVIQKVDLIGTLAFGCVGQVKAFDTKTESSLTLQRCGWFDGVQHLDWQSRYNISADALRAAIPGSFEPVMHCARATDPHLAISVDDATRPVQISLLD